MPVQGRPKLSSRSSSSASLGSTAHHTLNDSHPPLASLWPLPSSLPIALLLLLLTHTLYPKGVFASHLLPSLLFFDLPSSCHLYLPAPTYLYFLPPTHPPSLPYILLCNPPFLKEATFSIEYFCSRLSQLRLFNIRLSIFLTRDWIHRFPSNCLHHHLNRRPNRVRNHCRIIGPISKRSL